MVFASDDSMHFEFPLLLYVDYGVIMLVHICVHFTGIVMIPHGNISWSYLWDKVVYE